MDLGLVDKLGDMKDAIDSAARLAGLTEYSAHYIRKPLTVKDEIMQIFSGKITDWLLSVALPPSLLTLAKNLIMPIQELLLFDDPKGLYAHCMIHDLSL